MKYNNGSLVSSFRSASFDLEEPQQPGKDDRRWRMLRSGIHSSSSSSSSSSIGISRQQRRHQQELTSTAVSVGGEVFFLEANAPSIEEVNLMHKEMFIDSLGKANYMNALKEGKVVTGSFQMEISAAKEDNEEIKSNNDGKTSIFNIFTVGAGALLLFLIAGFGYYKWRSRSQLYYKSGKKRVMLSDDDGKMPPGLNVWNESADGATMDVPSLTPSTLATSKSFRSSSGNSYDDYSLDGSFAIGLSPNAGEQFLEGVMKMGEYPVHPTIDEGSRSSSVDNHDSTSVFSFSNQYTDSASLPGSAIGGMSIASSHFAGDKSKYLAHKTLTGRMNSEQSRVPLPLNDVNSDKCEDGIEVLIGGSVLESDAKTDLFDELYAPRPTGEETISSTILSVKDAMHEYGEDRNSKNMFTPTKEIISERTSNPLVEEDCNRNFEKMPANAQRVPAGKMSNIIDQPFPKDESQNDQNSTNVKYCEKYESKDMPSIKRTNNKSKSSTEQQICSPVERVLPAGEAEILADLQQYDPLCQRQTNMQSSPHKISVATMSSTQLKSNYPIQTQIHKNYSYSDSTDDESASYEGSSSDDSSFALSKPLQKAGGSTEPRMTINAESHLSPASKRKLLRGKNISRDRMNARIPPSSSPNSDNARLIPIRSLKDGMSSTNHAANVRRHRLAATLQARSADNNMLIQGEEELMPPSNIGKSLRKKRLQQQKIAGSFRKVRVQQGKSERTFAC